MGARLQGCGRSSAEEQKNRPPERDEPESDSSRWCEEKHSRALSRPIVASRLFMDTRPCVFHDCQPLRHLFVSLDCGAVYEIMGTDGAEARKRALEQNSAQVRYWLRTKYPAIRQQAKEKGALIWWGDESGLRSDHQAGTTWGEKGRTPVVKKSGKRFGCNMISAITNQGDMRFMVFEERFTGPVFLNFLERLVKSEKGRKVYLIVDRHSVHKSSKVEKWVQDNADKLSLFLLPPYSPELNPDELLRGRPAYGLHSTLEKV